MIRNHKYTVLFPMSFYTTIRGVHFSNQEMTLRPDGHMTIHVGAGSDGCSPTIKIPIVGIVGPWNGPINRTTNLPVTSRAFFLHDILVRYRNQIGISGSVANQEFCAEIRRSSFILAEFYAWIVEEFGPQ